MNSSSSLFRKSLLNVYVDMTDVKRFSCELLKPTAAIAIIGKRESGRSTLAHDIVQHFPDSSERIVMRPNTNHDNIYEDVTSTDKIYNEYDAEVMSDILAKQRARKRDGKKDSVVVVLDTCMFDKHEMCSRPFRDLYYDGRCYQTMMILCVSTPLELKPSLRGNLDWLFVFGHKTTIDVRRLHEQYGYIIGFEEFNEIFEGCTGEQYSCMVVHTTFKGENPRDAFYQYKVDRSTDKELSGQGPVDKSWSRWMKSMWSKIK